MISPLASWMILAGMMYPPPTKEKSMTTTVTVHAHCASTKEVHVAVAGQPERMLQVLQDGERTDVYAFDSRVISVKEVEKSASALPPHQQRVVDEKADLDEKRGKLESFLGSEIYNGLAVSEQDRLHAQSMAMFQYSSILGARIAAFPA